MLCVCFFFFPLHFQGIVFFSCILNLRCQTSVCTIMFKSFFRVRKLNKSHENPFVGLWYIYFYVMYWKYQAAFEFVLLWNGLRILEHVFFMRARNEYKSACVKDKLFRKISSSIISIFRWSSNRDHHDVFIQKKLNVEGCHLRLHKETFLRCSCEIFRSIILNYRKS